ncbi:OprO/OprP family phosphate-selective porin [Dyella sp. RRB7]|uniref:OprO/OprP family phosphate-selective porin n=1 Tax=Dyella sp. RRB7 TaxID=2919502 RepID=UPI001FAAD45F|nr:OprO/OprP family phosphate-selective porin [Dyella sp. RRB7]
MTSPITTRRSRLLALSIACALGLPLGVHAQSTTQGTSTKESAREQQLEKRVNQLEQELAELKAMIQEQKATTTQAAQTAQAAQATADQANTTAQAASTKVAAAATEKPQFTTAPGLSVALHGFISATAFGQDKTFSNYGNGQNAEVPAPPTAANKANGYAGSLSGVDIRNTRFWLDFTGAKFNDQWSGGGRIEMDFFGGNNGTGAYSQQQPIPRLRQAYMDIVNPDSGTTFRVGQMWDLMFPLENTATSLSHIAFPLGYGVGFIGWRYPGAIWMQDLNHGSDGVKWRLDVGVFEGNWNGPQNEAGTSNTNYLNAGAANFRPQVEARLHAQGSDWLAYFVAHYSKIDLNGVGNIAPNPIRDTLNSIGYEIGGQWKPGPWTFKGLAYSGKALGEIFGAMSQFGNIKESGGYVQAGYNFTPKWSAWAFYSMIRPNQNDVIQWTTTSPTAGTALLRDNQAALSLQYASGAYELGIEWMYDKLRYQVGADGPHQNVNGNQVNLSGLYHF